MQVPIREFYAEVTGKPVNMGNTATAQQALQRWGIPFSTTTPEHASKRFWKVDTKYVADAKHSYTLERAAIEAKRKPKKKEAPPPEGMDLAQRMANIEQELRTLNTVLINFVKKFEP